MSTRSAGTFSSVLAPAALLLLCACSTAPMEQPSTLPDASVETTQPGSPARNVILFIGDGLSVTTVTAMRILDGQQKGMTGEENVLSFERFPHLALSKTYTVDSQVGSSAATATAMLSGTKTNAGLVGVGPSVQYGDCASSTGNHLRSISEYAESAGLSTGVITTTRLTHATPAAAYAHTASRGWESDVDLTDEARLNGCTDIAAQLLDFDFGNGIEVAMGGGRSNFLPGTAIDPEDAGDLNLRQDGRDLVQEWLDKHPRAAYVWNSQQFDAINPQTTDHLLGLFNSSHMEYEVDRAEDPGGEPSLAQMTELAIEILQRNSRGYFLLVEGGRIDHAHHENNAYRALTEGIALADAVAVADEMTSEDETLIIVTADHSHTMTMAGYPIRGNPILGKVKGDMSEDTACDLMADEKPYTTIGYQNGPGGDWVGGPRPDLSDVDTIHDKDFIQQAGLPLDSESHAGEDVAVYARGPGAEQVNGVMEQNLIFDVMEAALNIRERSRR